jgi:hypothetical protein
MNGFSFIFTEVLAEFFANFDEANKLIVLLSHDLIVSQEESKNDKKICFNISI